MNDSDVWLSLSREIALLYRETGWLSLGGFVLALLLASWFGAGVRRVVSWLWKLNLDRSRNLATLGTVVQLCITGLATVGLLGHGLRTAPGVTLLIVLVALPTSGLVFRGLWQNFLAGLSLLLQRHIREGDDIALADGRTGKVERIFLLSTCLMEGRGQLIVPNALLLSSPVQKLPRQAGLALKMVLPAPHQPRVEELDRARKVLVFSPFRAAGSEVSVRRLSSELGLELSMRVFSESAKGPAMRELGQKVPQALKWNESKEE